MSKVVCLKMVSGHDLIARKHSEFTYSKIRVLHMYQDGHGEPKSGLMPYLTMNPDVTATLRPELIVCEYECPTEVERSYSEAVSGLILS